MNARLRAQVGVMLTLAVAGASGCAEELDSPHELKILRVLGMQKSPVWPAPGETVTLTPIVYTPDGSSVTSYDWSWCPFVGSANDGYPCMVTVEQLAGTVSGVPPADLGHESTAQFPYTIDPATLNELCTKGLPGMPELPDCRFGFAVPIRMKIKATNPEDELEVVDTLRVRLAATAPANNNPVLGGFTAVVNGIEVPLDDTAQVTIPRGVQTKIQLKIPETAVDEYDNPLLSKCATVEPKARESLSLRWFVECGSLDKVESGYQEGINSFEDAGKNKWDPGLLKDCDRQESRIIVVARDARHVLPQTATVDDPCEIAMGNRLANGVAWASAKVRLGDPQ